MPRTGGGVADRPGRPYAITDLQRRIQEAQRFQLTTIDERRRTRREEEIMEEEEAQVLPILRHNAETNTTFLGEPDGGCTFGWELEVAVPERNDISARSLLFKENKKLGGAFQLKHDGSIVRNYNRKVISYPIGFELVTKPFYWSWWEDNADTFDNIFTGLIKNKVISHQMGTCGLHVHIAGLTVAQRMRFYKLLTLNPEFLILTRRDKTGYCYVNPKWSITNEDLRYYMENPGTMSRYGGCIYTVHGTMEVRIFRGTLNFHSFQASLQFVKSAVDYIKGTSKLNPTSEDYYEYYENNLRNSYPYLTNYLQERKVI